MFNSKDYLNKNVQVIMDRPLGSKHPKHGFEYLTNYGYIPNTISGDGEELDAYGLGVDVFCSARRRSLLSGRPVRPSS